jgi:hypothetical protein
VSWYSRLALGAAVALVAPVLAPTPVSAQARVVRFEVTAVSDTSLNFRVGPEKWVAPGQTGSAVDPRRRDPLVARLRVAWVQDGIATAMVTGQTTAVSIDHVVTMEAPSRRWYKAVPFWAGVFLGGALGVATTALTK